MDKPASSDTENEASRETEIGLLAEAFRERHRARQRLHSLPMPSVKGLAWGGDCVRTPRPPVRGSTQGGDPGRLGRSQ